MYGEGYGGVSGEVMKKHLTIGKADKQRDSGHFGEVLPSFLQKLFRKMVCCSCGQPAQLSQTVSELVEDIP